MIAHPEEHSSLVGGSTAARRIGCPRSYALEKKAPADEGSVYAREGTALHALMAKVIDEDVEPLDILPFVYTQPEEGWSWTIDEVTWAEQGEPALAAFDAFISRLEDETDHPGQTVVMVERRCAMPGIPGAFGTSDILIRNHDVAVVWDWKFGQRPVRATDNAQLQFYARAAAADYHGMFAGVRKIGLAIMQPAVAPAPDVWWTDMDQLERFRAELTAAVKVAEEELEKAPIAKGPWCQFATCKSVCPLWVGQSMALAERLAKAGIRTNDGSRKVHAADILDELPALLELAAEAESWAKALRSAAHSHLESGGRIDGWKLVEKRSSGRKWTRDEAKIRQWFSRNGVPVDEYAPRQLITPPAAEKVLKLHGKELPERLYERLPSSGASLAREDSERPEYLSATTKIAALAERLKPHLEE